MERPFYHSQFTRVVHQLDTEVSPAWPPRTLEYIALSRKFNVLRQLCESPAFTYKSESEERTGKLALLLLWKKLLLVLETLSDILPRSLDEDEAPPLGSARALFPEPSARVAVITVALKTITLIMRREEFRVTETKIGLMQQYVALVTRTCDLSLTLFPRVIAYMEQCDAENRLYLQGVYLSEKRREQEAFVVSRKRMKPRNALPSEEMFVNAKAADYRQGRHERLQVLHVWIAQVLATSFFELPLLTSRIVQVVCDMNATKTRKIFATHLLVEASTAPTIATSTVVSTAINSTMSTSSSASSSSASSSTSSSSSDSIHEEDEKEEEDWTKVFDSIQQESRVSTVSPASAITTVRAWITSCRALKKDRSSPQFDVVTERRMQFLFANPCFFGFSTPQLVQGYTATDDGEHIVQKLTDYKYQPRSALLRAVGGAETKTALAELKSSFLAGKGHVYFLFFSAYLQHVLHKAAPDREVVWPALPGYWQLLETFLVLTAVAPLASLPASANELLVTLLGEDCAVSPGDLPEQSMTLSGTVLLLSISLLVSRTNLFCLQQVNQNLDAIDAVISCYVRGAIASRSVSAETATHSTSSLSGHSSRSSTGSSGRNSKAAARESTMSLFLDEPGVTDLACPLPPGFCFDDLFEALDRMLQTDHFQTLLKALTFLYMHMGRFYGKQRRKVLMNLIYAPKHFLKLFLHWSVEVRRCFQLLLVYRTQRTKFGLQSWLCVDISVQQQPEATKEEQKQQQHTLFSSFDALWNRPQMTVTEDTEAHSKDPLLEWCVLCKTKMTFTEHETDRLAGRWLNTYLTQMYARIGVCVPSFPVLEAIVIPPKVTDKLVTLALQSLYEHVQAFHRLQQRTERGHSNPFALLVPRLYFQIK